LLVHAALLRRGPPFASLTGESRSVQPLQAVVGNCS
jgi:hypothetical protein